MGTSYQDLAMDWPRGIGVEIIDSVHDAARTELGTIGKVQMAEWEVSGQ